MMADPDKRAELREAAMQRQRRRPGVPGRFIQWGSLVVSKTALDKNRALQGKKLTQLAEELGKHVADVMLDLAVEEKLDTEFQLQSRPPENDVALAEYVRSGHALPSQSDAGAHLNTNYCTAGESSWVLGEWVRERGLLSLEDAIRRYTFQPARIMGLARPRSRARGHGRRPHGVRPGPHRREGRRGLARRPRRHAATRAGRRGREPRDRQR